MSIFGKIASLGVGEILRSVGSLAKDIRTAITGDLDPAQKARIQERLIELEQGAQEAEQTLLKAQAQIITAEAQGESFLQRNWRPILMLSCVAIVVNNYILYPYLSLFWAQAPTLELPDALWRLLTLGVSGYVVGRSTEKCVKIWKDKEQS